METRQSNQTQQPPRLFSSITTGFNLVASNIQLILFPLFFDLLLWFGPRVRLKTLLEPFVIDMFKVMAETKSPELAEMARATRELWDIALEQFNLLTALRAYPVGIPSLLVAEGTLKTPLGNPPILEMSSFISTFLLWMGFTLVGMIVGSFYFNGISRHSSTQPEPFKFGGVIWQIGQTLALTVTVLVIILILSIPVSLLLTVLAMISPLLVQISVLIISFLLLWLLIPLVFSPHGIFVYRQNFLSSMLTSLRLVRFTFPVTGMLLLVLVLIGQGLDTLWKVPPETSWMAFVGILGHAFISTGVLMATFVYYRTGTSWLSENMNKVAQQAGINIK